MGEYFCIGFGTLSTEQKNAAAAVIEALANAYGTDTKSCSC